MFLRRCLVEGVQVDAKDRGSFAQDPKVRTGRLFIAQGSCLHRGSVLQPGQARMELGRAGHQKRVASQCGLHLIHWEGLVQTLEDFKVVQVGGILLLRRLGSSISLWSGTNLE